MSSYTGRQPNIARQYQLFTATASQTDFDLQAPPVNFSVIVYVNKSFKRPGQGEDYIIVSPKTLRFASGLSSNDKVDVYYDYTV